MSTGLTEDLVVKREEDGVLRVCGNSAQTTRGVLSPISSLLTAAWGATLASSVSGPGEEGV
ncbi:hypothetical protein BON30_02925 [Cystobacter ferrugineus]|uniref:Uncharacterized protein n=1 Tax=Cystobacter ferrugineus TaxID=83449 RepID=A0A1L9BIQ4_9BACT|nr:hypothetical protein BON30_02925 [Cystobacter ferrugineus]